MSDLRERELLKECEAVLVAFCRMNPIWHTTPSNTRQDPYGAHALLAKVRAALLAPPVSLPGRELKVGDRVLIPAVVKETVNEYGRVFLTCDSDEDLYVDAETIRALAEPSSKPKSSVETQKGE